MKTVQPGHGSQELDRSRRILRAIDYLLSRGSSRPWKPVWRRAFSRAARKAFKKRAGLELGELLVMSGYLIEKKRRQDALMVTSRALYAAKQAAERSESAKLVLLRALILRAQALSLEDHPSAKARACEALTDAFRVGAELALLLPREKLMLERCMMQAEGAYQTLTGTVRL